MQSDDLPAEFDAIVLGTGMCESIVAAALARVGLTVLHVDRYDNYGGDWASYNFSALQQWITEHKTKDTTPVEQSQVETALNDGEKMIMLSTESQMVSNVCESIHVSEGNSTPTVEESSLITLADEPGNFGDGVPATVSSTGDDVQQTSDENAMDVGTDALTEHPTSSICDPSASSDTAMTATPESSNDTSGKSDGTELGSVHPWTLSDIKHLWRKFNIDLMPKLLYCRGPLVELLISSDVAKYCEFRSVSRVLTAINNKLEKVPCSRADVFASHNVGVIEKRMLMKLLTFCLEFDKNPSEYAEFAEKPFVEFLKSKKLTETVRHYVQRAIAMVPDTATTFEGLTSTQRFLQSLGRYGNTAFLWPIYGSGELPQCFARMCAVFGGIYCLRRQATAAILDKDDKLTAVITSTGQRIKTKWLVMESSYASLQLLPNLKITSKISRAILLTDRSLQPDNQQHITLLSLPVPGVDNATVTVYELSSISMACPDKLFVVHLTCRSIADNATADLQPIVNSLFSAVDDTNADDVSRPRVLWSLYFNVNNTTRCDLATNNDNIIVVSGPDEFIDYDSAVIEAKKSFEKICPGDEFLPKAPNAEDIIYDDGEAGGTGESGFEACAETPTAECCPATSVVEDSAAVAALTSGVVVMTTDDVTTAPTDCNEPAAEVDQS